MRDDRTYYIRFSTTHLNEETGYPAGLFTALWDVREAAETCEYDREMLQQHLMWFGANLQEPKRFSRLKTAGFRYSKGLCWFRTSSVEYVSRMHEMAAIVFEYGHTINKVCTRKPGVIVYEDRLQIVAEPFADTPLC